jgi:hypothetical protein
MGDRYWLWMGARLLAGVAISAWAASYLSPGGGEKEFQKTLEAMKSVHTFRVALTSDMAGVQHSDMLWEIDCDKDVLHHRLHSVLKQANGPTEINQDDYHVASRNYMRHDAGAWTEDRYAGPGTSAKWFCGQLAQGTDSNILPQISTMIKRGILQKGDKKTVNGVRCREWLVTMKGGTSGLEHDTVCLGLDDHLPYEMTVDWEHSRSTFSDYNSPMHFDLPDAVLQPASETMGSN